jgi:large subunit ribosomal protein L32
MAVPRNRTSNARKNSRRSHMAKDKINVIKCSNCHTSTLPHRICESCGFYNKKQVITKEV